MIWQQMSAAALLPALLQVSGCLAAATVHSLVQLHLKPLAHVHRGVGMLCVVTAPEQQQSAGRTDGRVTSK